ncbi:hypothetical protein TorRG33x02_314760 [Trema orientale]|uniref:Uncharacterized protein n=1 Tax=Trema orientale TaxID=63057 RepID=A0A2P5BNG8_TREOI|nr:hypothetical protein TorRG33x02_314760 [Trema orientale]
MIWSISEYAQQASRPIGEKSDPTYDLILGQCKEGVHELILYCLEERLMKNTENRLKQLYAPTHGSLSNTVGNGEVEGRSRDSGSDSSLVQSLSTDQAESSESVMSFPAINNNSIMTQALGRER